MKRLTIVIAVAFLAACGQGSQTGPEAPAGPTVAAPAFGDSPVDQLVGCAGAVARIAGIDPTAGADISANAWEPDYTALMLQLERDHSMDHAMRTTGAAGAATQWDNVGPEHLEERVMECRARFNTRPS